MKIPDNRRISKIKTGHGDSVVSYNIFKRFLDMV